MTVNRLIQNLEHWKSRAVGNWGVWIEDLTSATTWAWNETKSFYAASIIKVPIMVAVYKQAFLGRLALADEIILTAEDQVGGTGVLQHLSPGLRLSVQDLTTLMIIQSDNTATNILIDLLGTETIRETMDELGMRQSTFHNKLMIVPAAPAGLNMITAADVARCFRHIAQGKVVSQHASRQMVEILKKQQLRDCLPTGLPSQHGDIIGWLPEWELAHKTGMVTRTLHDAGILFTKSRAVVMVALSEECEYEQAQQQMKQLARLVYEACLESD
ncbi:serine hydrolase [Laceyella tengchongensis]